MCYVLALLMVDKSKNTCKMSNLCIQMTARLFLKHQTTGFERMSSLCLTASYWSQFSDMANEISARSSCV